MTPPRTVLDIVMSKPEAGMTIASIARFLGIHAETLVSLINGRQDSVQLRTIAKIAKVYGLTPQTVLDSVREGYKCAQATRVPEALSPAQGHRKPPE